MKIEYRPIVNHYRLMRLPNLAVIDNSVEILITLRVAKYQHDIHIIIGRFELNNLLLNVEELIFFGSIAA